MVYQKNLITKQIADNTLGLASADVTHTLVSVSFRSRSVLFGLASVASTYCLIEPVYHERTEHYIKDAT